LLCIIYLCKCSSSFIYCICWCMGCWVDWIVSFSWL